jgi:hypothetical protein
MPLPHAQTGPGTQFKAVPKVVGASSESILMLRNIHWSSSWPSSLWPLPWTLWSSSWSSPCTLWAAPWLLWLFWSFKTVPLADLACPVGLPLFLTLGGLKGPLRACLARPARPDAGPL